MRRFRLSAFLLIGCTHGLCAVGGSNSQDVTVLTTFLSEFNQAARSKNYGKIAKLLGNVSVKDVRRTLGGKSVTTIQKESMLSLISKSKSVVIMPVVYENNFYRKYGNGYTVFFIVSESVSDVLVGKKVWLQDYAACDFFIKDHNVNYGPVLCYDETEGPFPVKYDDL